MQPDSQLCVAVEYTCLENPDPKGMCFLVHLLSGSCQVDSMKAVN